ncbi:MAG: hypothetical protein BWX50_01640 [Euryarchaeota archaeon ADurb.Bin009]|nr:MAG: hypothetical protein BWX50_01640 [Euryarchaeota archaeon ADurb.Bin009]
MRTKIPCSGEKKNGIRTMGSQQRRAASEAATTTSLRFWTRSTT